MTKLDAKSTKELEKRFSSVSAAANNSDSEIEDDDNGERSDDFDDESSDDDHVWTQKVKEEHKKLREEAWLESQRKKDEKTFKKISGKFGSQSFTLLTSLMASDLRRQDINRFYSFSRCLNGTFP